MKLKKKIIIVGNNSFIQKNFFELYKKKLGILKLKFSEVNSFKFNPNHIVINCSQDKKFFTKKYKKENDRNLKIAEILSPKNTQLIILSSRNVYKPKLGISENSQIQPIDLYGKNCLKSENNCKKILRKLTILRLSNVVGNESMKKKRLSLMSMMINGIKKKHIKFDNSYEWYKDLIPVRIFCLYLEKIILKKYYGVLNVGSGYKIKIKDFIKYLNLNKKIRITISNKNIKKKEYSYKITKLKKIAEIHYAKKLIIKEYNDLGRSIQKI